MTGQLTLTPKAKKIIENILDEHSDKSYEIVLRCFVFIIITAGLMSIIFPSFYEILLMLLIALPGIFVFLFIFLMPIFNAINRENTLDRRTTHYLLKHPDINSEFKEEIKHVYLVNKKVPVNIIAVMLKDAKLVTLFDNLTDVKRADINTSILLPTLSDKEYSIIENTIKAYFTRSMLIFSWVIRCVCIVILILMSVLTLNLLFNPILFFLALFFTIFWLCVFFTLCFRILPDQDWNINREQNNEEPLSAYVLNQLIKHPAINDKFKNQLINLIATYGSIPLNILVNSLYLNRKVVNDE